MKVFARNSMQGVWGAKVLQDHVVTDTEFDFYIRDKFDIKEFQGAIDDEDMGFIILDFPVDKGYLPSLESMGEFNTAPFLHGYVFASYGEEPSNMHTFVEEADRSPILAMWEELHQANLIEGDLSVGKSTGSRIVEAVDNYHFYNIGEQHHPQFDQHAENMAIDHMLVYEHYGEDMLKEKGGLPFELSTHIDNYQLCRNLNRYVQRVADRAVIKFAYDNTENRFPVIILHCERFQNEVAYRISTTLQKGGYPNVAVLVGSYTKGDDIYRVRTVGDIHAGELAKALNNGGGKQHTASVFLPSGQPPIYDAVIDTINDINRDNIRIER